jgi:hypothetical protein
MSGGITQLVAIGAQDVWLTGRPEVSFFRNNYKRYTNFAHVVNRQVLQGAVNPSGMSSIRFDRKGDMLSYVYLTKRVGGAQVNFTANDIDHIDFLIGGQIIDSQDDYFINNVADQFLVSSQNKAIFTTSGNTGYFYPFQFWFCANWQSALPLIALQFHDIEARIYWKSTVSTTSIFEAWGDFIVLDTMERDSLASGVQNHLIYQVQKSLPSGTGTQNLVFNHPVKFISSGSANIISGNTYSSTMLFQVNGVDIGEQKTYTPHFDMVPAYYTAPFTTISQSTNGFLLPFCLDTTKLQPTGTLNFSRIDSARLITSSTFVGATLYAVNYNILKIENGMGGLMYAN